MTTDTEHIIELREAAEEAQAARNEVITEVARLTAALRTAERGRNTAITELITLRLALINAESCRAEAERQANIAKAERDASRAGRRSERRRFEAERDAAERDLLSQLDDARTKAERVAKVMNVIAYEVIGDMEASYATVYVDIVEMACAALAAYRASIGKTVTK